MPPVGNDDILWVGLDVNDLDVVEATMDEIVANERHPWRRLAQDVLVTIQSARDGDWKPPTTEEG